MGSSKISRHIFVQSPTKGNGKSAFLIIERVDGKAKSIKNDQLNLINTRFKSNQIQFEEARNLVKNLVKQLRPKPIALFLPYNEKILQRYWDEEYTQRRIIDPKSAMNRLRRAVRALGNLPLDGSTQKELQLQIDSHFKGNKQRAIIAPINSLLKFLGVNFQLRLDHPELLEVRYISESEFEKVSSHIKDPHIKLMHEIAFATGLRAGEIFAIIPEAIRDNKIRVAVQFDVHRVRRATKNRKERDAYILKAYRNKVLEWAKIPLNERLAFRKRSISKITRKASLEALGREVTFHDLRHSYVKYLLNKGDSLTRIAKYIGDGIQVTERYYAGFLSSSEEAAITDKLDI